MGTIQNKQEIKLLSMTDFVLERKSELHYFKVTQNYANFLKQPLELWMFVPCDSDGNVILEIEFLDKYKKLFKSEFVEKYQQAKERCLFEGNFTTLKQKDYYIIYLDESAIYLTWNKSKIIEDIVSYNLQLTQTAIKQIGL